RGTYFGGTNVLQTISTLLWLGGNTYPKEYFQGLIDNVRSYNWGSCAAGVVLAIDLLLLPQATGLLASHLAQIGAAVSGFLADGVGDCACTEGRRASPERRFSQCEIDSHSSR